MPYDRPPLSKKLWFGKKTVEEIFVHGQDFYTENSIDVAMGVHVSKVDASNSTAIDSLGQRYTFGKLLLATGGVPRKLSIPGGNLEGISYYRYLDDYLQLRVEAAEGKSAVVIGGGFIGSEMAAALNLNKVEVTMIFPEQRLLHRIFPAGLADAVHQDYIKRGVTLLSEDAPESFEKRGGKYVTRTKSGKSVESDMIVVGIGISPSIELAQSAGLAADNGIVVNEYLQTSRPNIYAAGDIAHFPYKALGKNVRIEHWDNAINQGKHAGLNMAGANEPFIYMPYFFSDLFDFGFEAVGDINSQLDTFADWQKENDTGVIYYLNNGKVVGAMMCNVWDKVPDARELIKVGKIMTTEELKGAIKG
jgi:3-phenylpropionate/trans-cinnamate dioxygenase ferredoxin reductase component